ncbi:hypothetical protein [Bacillus sp. Cr_A10]|uniref:hypothetical protein n=1 Tax=Bacillus sp. Cr_A10 TaxID=3033993 RepID=UPI0023D98208|nr:hypothetical protein [Bacillus sp. Cr_A10]MDF2065621.1 hypothetical protein [Bacillus sp. Cr_A10]
MVKISDLIDDFKMNQQIQGRKDKYNENHLAMNYFTKFTDICKVRQYTNKVKRFTSVK